MTLQTLGYYGKAPRRITLALTHWPRSDAAAAVLLDELVGTAPPVVVEPPAPDPGTGQTLFASQWAASNARTQARMALLRQQEKERQSAQAHAARVAALAAETARQEREFFPAPRETTPQEMAGYTALAAAMVRADIQRQLAEQLAVQRAQQEAVQLVLEMQAAAEREQAQEIELLLLMI